MSPSASFLVIWLDVWSGKVILFFVNTLGGIMRMNGFFDIKLLTKLFEQV